MYPIITISREFGSGGHSIGQKVAETLGIPFIDGEIVHEVALESGYSEDMIKDQGEYASPFDHYCNTNFYPAIYMEIPQDHMFRVQRDIILDYAKKGPCVIVGRCADYILAHADIPSLNIFIHADYDHRAARVLEKYGDNGTPIEKRLKQKDKGRKSYYRYYTDRHWGDYKNYQLNLDSGALGEDMCVGIIVNTARMMDK